MTYLASISLIQEATATAKESTNQNANTNTLISILILVKLLPNVFFLPIGGILADSYDRRKIQVALDLCSSCVVVVFLWSLSRKSIILCLVANFLIETFSGLYIPSNQAMLPQLFDNCSIQEEKDSQLKKATLLYGLSWSLMAAIGSSLGGALVAVFGIKGCFVIDSITYLLSAAILCFGVKGNFNASNNETRRRSATATEVAVRTRSSSFSTSVRSLSLPGDQREEDDEENSADHPDRDKKDPGNGEGGSFLVFLGGIRFLFSEQPLVGACALLKGSAALAYGAVDVLNVAFSSRGTESDPSTTSFKLGLLFGCVGVGCILGSVATDALSDLAYPRGIARVTLGGFACISVAMFWMAATPDIFVSLCLSTVTRSIGSSIVWINSTLLIQKFTPPALLGRVSSFDSGVALFAEALSELGGGMLMDQKDLPAEDLSLVLAGIATCFFFFWIPLVFRFERGRKEQSST